MSPTLQNINMVGENPQCEIVQSNTRPGWIAHGPHKFVCELQPFLTGDVCAGNQGVPMRLLMSKTVSKAFPPKKQTLRIH
jgi:hypothetical protein